jgi:hypothetical protein
MQGAVLGLAMTAITAYAAPTAQIQGGQTSLVLSEDSLQALVSCQVDRIKPAVVKPGGDRLRFSIGSGALDLDSTLGEIEHRGGVLLQCDGGANVVGLQNFRIDHQLAETDTDPAGVSELRVTGLVSVNGSLTERIPVFTPLDENVDISVNGNVLRIRDVSLGFTEEVIALLLEQLGLSVPADVTIARSYTRLVLRPGQADSGADGEKGNNGLAKGKDKDKSQDDDEESGEEIEEEAEEDSQVQ